MTLHDILTIKRSRRWLYNIKILIKNCLMFKCFKNIKVKSTLDKQHKIPSTPGQHLGKKVSVYEV